MVLSTSLAVLALAAGGVQPLSGESVTGTLAFPRPQQMSIKVGGNDRLSLALGFDGTCAGGGLGELWMSFVPANGTLKVRDGAFSGKLSGRASGVGGSKSRTASFSWSVSGRFTAHQVGTATVSGSALVKEGGKVVSRCTIAKPAAARLTHS
jgi:hypothetical protein